MSALEVKCTLRGHALMSASNRKRTSGRRSLNGMAARKRPLAKKIADTGGVAFLRFQFRFSGGGWGLMEVSRNQPGGRNLLLFFQCGWPSARGAIAPATPLISWVS